MSLLRLGRNPDGSREVRLLEPETAKRTGWGGTALGYFSGTTIQPKRRGLGDDTVKETPENQGVEPTESRRFRP